MLLIIFQALGTRKSDRNCTQSFLSCIFVRTQQLYAVQRSTLDNLKAHLFYQTLAQPRVSHSSYLPPGIVSRFLSNTPLKYSYTVNVTA